MDWVVESSCERGACVHTVEDIATNQLLQVHIVRMRPHSDATLERHVGIEGNDCRVYGRG